jgi:hypothetical protein
VRQPALPAPEGFFIEMRRCEIPEDLVDVLDAVMLQTVVAPD